MRTMYLAAALSALAAPAAAEQDHLSLVNKEVREVLFMDLYAVAVWSDDGELTDEDMVDDSQRKRLMVEVLYDGSMPEIPESWSHELKPELTPEQWEALQTNYRRLGEGDRVFVTYDPETGTEVSEGGRTFIETSDHGLMEGFLHIWFGEDPIRDEFRADFLSEG